MAVGEVLAVVAVGGFGISSAGLWAWRAYRTGRLRRGWLWLRVKTLGGVTTLDRKLRYGCAICQQSLDVNDKVRKLSCGHVFHYGWTEKCEVPVDKWLYEGSMTCPFCRKTATPVWPWNARPPLSAAATSSSESLPGSSTEGLLPPSTTVMVEEEEEPPLSP